MTWLIPPFVPTEHYVIPTKRENASAQVATGFFKYFIGYKLGGSMAQVFLQT